MQKGIIILSDNYTYEGTILYKEPHGIGKFEYSDGSKYIGECKFGKPDGYGTYTFEDGSSYQGYFSTGKFHGIGTYENDFSITKGPWRSDRRHGHFILTQKREMVSFRQLWINDKLNHTEGYQYIRPDVLQTTKCNPLHKKKKIQIPLSGAKKCIGCETATALSTNITCGHACMCYNCLSKCERCPICRVPIKSIIHLYTQ